MNSGFVYIMTNPSRSVFYIGVTNNLFRRVFEHKNKKIEGFTHKYNCVVVVYHEYFETIKEAIRREKQLKSWKREWKLRLIKTKIQTFETFGKTSGKVIVSYEKIKHLDLHKSMTTLGLETS